MISNTVEDQLSSICDRYVYLWRLIFWHFDSKIQFQWLPSKFVSDEVRGFRSSEYHVYSILVRMNGIFASGKSWDGFFGAVLAVIQRLSTIINNFALSSLKRSVFVAVIAYFSAGIIVVLVALLIILWEVTSCIWWDGSVGWSKTASKACSKWRSRTASSVARVAISTAVWDQEGSGKACSVHVINLRQINQNVYSYWLFVKLIVVELSEFKWELLIFWRSWLVFICMGPIKDLLLTHTCFYIFNDNMFILDTHDQNMPTHKI